jgi:hypothetical protein
VTAGVRWLQKGHAMTSSDELVSVEPADP